MIRNLLPKYFCALVVLAVTTVGAHASSCVAIQTGIYGNTCRATVTNYCNRPLRCNVTVEGYTWQGKLYREQGVVRINGNGGQGWYGIDGVRACGDARTNCVWN